MLLRCPSHTPFILLTHLDSIVYSLLNDLNLRAKSDGNGQILMKIRLGEVWCLHDEFRSQHSPSHSFIDTGLLSTYYAYNCSLWYHISSRESISRYDISVLFIISTQQVGTSTAALSWLEEVDDDDGVCGVCSAMAGASYIPTPTSTSLLVHIYIGIHSTFFGRISMRTDSSSWKFYLLAVFCTCILPFPAEFPELLAGRRGNFFMAF